MTSVTPIQLIERCDFYGLPGSQTSGAWVPAYRDPLFECLRPVSANQIMRPRILLDSVLPELLAVSLLYDYEEQPAPLPLECIKPSFIVFKRLV